jgi:hypothetical protein
MHLVEVEGDDAAADQVRYSPAKARTWQAVVDTAQVAAGQRVLT